MNLDETFLIRFFRRAWRQWRHEITPGGKLIVAGIVFSMVGTLDIHFPVYQFFCTLVVFTLVCGTVGVVLRPRVRLSGQLPLKAVVGETTTVQMTVANRSRLPVYDLSLGFYGLTPAIEELAAEHSIPYVPGKETVTIPVPLRPRRRGLHEVAPLRAFSTFPFNLGRFGRNRHDLESLLVLPDFHPLVHLDIPVGRRHQPGGIALTSNVGESPEYIGNREYVAGDSPRRIDFRSWARLAVPVVKEYQEEYFCRVALIVDTFVPGRNQPPPDGFPELEAAISLAAAVASALDGGEYILDIFAAGPELYVFRTGRHTAPFENVLEILACVDACRQNPFETVTPALAEEIGRISTAVCIFLDWDDHRRQLVRTIQEAGCETKTIVIRDGATTQPAIGGDLEVFSPRQVRSGGVEEL